MRLLSSITVSLLTASAEQTRKKSGGPQKRPSQESAESELEEEEYMSSSFRVSSFLSLSEYGQVPRDEHEYHNPADPPEEIYTGIAMSQLTPLPTSPGVS